MTSYKISLYLKNSRNDVNMWSVRPKKKARLMFYRSGGRCTENSCLYKSGVIANMAALLCCFENSGWQKPAYTDFYSIICCAFSKLRIFIVCRTSYSEDMHVAIKILIGVGIATVLIAIVAIPVGVTVASGIWFF